MAFYGKRLQKAVTKLDVLNSIGDMAIMEWLFKVKPAPGLKIKNPFRDDRTPGTYFKFRNGRILYVDKAWKEAAEAGYKPSWGLDCFDVIGVIYKLKDFNEIISLVENNFNISVRTKVPRKEVSVIWDAHKEVKQFTTVLRNWNKGDKEYWSSYGISRKTLERWNVNPTQKLYIDGTFYTDFSYKPNVYGLWEGPYVKVYNPFGEKGKKFRTNFKHNIVSGEFLINDHYEKNYPDNKPTFITSSTKDAMLLYELGYAALAPISESTFIPKELLAKLKNPVIWYDNDEAGVMYAEKFSREYGVPHIYVESEAKDPSDMYKAHGKDFLTNILENLNGQYTIFNSGT